MSSHRYILPAPKGPQSIENRSESSSNVTSSGSNVPPPSQPKRTATKAACDACRKRKSKCDGARPYCSACADRGVEHCHYEVDEGQTWGMALKQQIRDLKDVISGLSLATDTDAAMAIVSKLQSNEFRNLEEVASTVRNSTVVTISSAPGSYQTQIDVSDANMHFMPTEGSIEPEQSISRTRSVYAYPIQPERRAGSHSRDRVELSKTRGRYWFEPMQLVKELDTLATISAIKSLPIHLVQVANGTDDRFASTRYTDFIRMKRRLIEDGHSPAEVLGPATMDPTRLLEESPTPSGVSEPVCHWATETVKQFDKMCVAERLAMIILVSALARWQIYPSWENYEDIPECLKPTPMQLLVPHPAWIDYIPWPEIRDYFIKSPVDAEHGNPLEMITNHTHINWDENHDTMVQMDPRSNSFLIHEEFERYGRDINNWSLDHAVAARFPDIADKAWIKEHIHARDASFVEEDMRAFRALIYEHDPTLTDEYPAGH